MGFDIVGHEGLASSIDTLALLRLYAGSAHKVGTSGTRGGLIHQVVAVGAKHSLHKDRVSPTFYEVGQLVFVVFQVGGQPSCSLPRLFDIVLAQDHFAGRLLLQVLFLVEVLIFFAGYDYDWELRWFQYVALFYHLAALCVIIINYYKWIIKFTSSCQLAFCPSGRPRLVSPVLLL